jgi:hypothetical protein
MGLNAVAGKTLAAAGFLLLLAVTRTAYTQESADLAALQDTLEKWVETKKLISSEKQKIREQEDMLKSRIDLLSLRLDDVKEKRGKIKADDAEAEERSAALHDEEAALSKALDSLRGKIAELEQRTLAVLRSAPEPLKLKVEGLSQQVPKNPDETDLSLSIRYQNVIGILNSMNAFNNEVTLSTEVRKLGPDNLVEVRVLYFGLGQAYFCNKDATIGGVGTPGNDAWVWERNDRVAPAVAAMIAQHLNEQSAAYEAVPVTTSR